MNLHAQPFERIRRGEKIYELRLYDEKRKRIAVGDVIRFTCRKNGDTVCAKVVSLHPFDSFETLYSSLDVRLLGYAEEELSSASPEDMAAYYSPEEIQKYGVLAIEIKLL